MRVPTGVATRSWHFSERILSFVDAEFVRSHQPCQSGQHLCWLMSGRADLFSDEPIEHPSFRWLIHADVDQCGGVQHDHWPSSLVRYL